MWEVIFYVSLFLKIIDDWCYDLSAGMIITVTAKVFKTDFEYGIQFICTGTLPHIRPSLGFEIIPP